MSTTSSSQHELLTLRVVPDRDRIILELTGELDLSTMDQIDHAVRDLRAVGFDHVVVDLRALTFLDSSGLHLLLGLHGDAVQNGQTLELVAGGREVQRLFDLTGSTHRFTWRDGVGRRRW